MTGRRKGTGQAVRRVESLRRAIATHRDRVARSTDPAARMRAATELVLAVVRRVDPVTAHRLVTRVIREIGRAVREAERSHR